MKSRGFSGIILLLLVLVTVIAIGGYFIYSNNTNNTSVVTNQTINNPASNTPSVAITSKKATTKINDLKAPNFGNQELKNLRIDKSKIDTNSVPNLKPTKQGFSFISTANAQESSSSAVYKVKRSSLTSDQAIAIAKDWGFSEEPRKKDIRNDYEYFLEWGSYSSSEGTAVIKENFATGIYDKFDINLVWDKTGNYGLGPYHRNSLNWHKSVTSISDTPVPSIEEAKQIVTDFLKSKDLLPPGTLKFNVIKKDDLYFSGNAVSGANTVVFVERTIDGLQVIDGGVSFKPETTRLMIGLRGNTVVGLSYEESMTQIDYDSFDYFSIKEEKEAFDDLLNSKSLVGKVKVTNNFIVNGSPVQDSFDIDLDWSRNQIKDIVMKDVSLAYYRNENQTYEPVGNYYQPVYLFHTTATASGDFFTSGEQQVEMTFYVPAVKF